MLTREGARTLKLNRKMQGYSAVEEFLYLIFVTPRYERFPKSWKVAANHTVHNVKQVYIIYWG